MTQTARYILDTNIWLDWLVFQNDSLDELKKAHAKGHFVIIYTDEMLEEFIDVIGRAQFKLTLEQQGAAKLAVMQIAKKVETKAKPMNSIHCQDKDDQIFIDMALAHQAQWLISKDKHLLALKNRAAKQLLKIGTADKWFQSENKELTNR